MSEPKRVLMLLHEDPTRPGGGMGVHVDALARRLSAHCDVVVLGCHAQERSGLFSVSATGVERCAREWWTRRRGAYRLLLAENTNEHLALYGAQHDVMNYQNFAVSYARYLRGERFDLLHLHDTYLYPTAQLVQAMHRQLPLVLTAHLSFFAVHDPHPESPSYRWGVQSEQAAYVRADRVITVSETYRRMLLDVYLVQTPVVVVQNGVDVGALDQIVPVSTPVEDSRPVVGFIGRLVPSKGIDLVLEAAKRMPDVRFVLFARTVASLEDGYDLVDRTRAAAENLDNVTWFGALRHGEHWSLAKGLVDVAVMPSLHEPFGIVALEWMAARKPLVVSAVGGLPEFCHATNSVLVDPTTDQLEKGIRRVLGMPSAERAHMIDAGRATAEQLNWDIAAQKTEEVYEDVCREGRLAA